MDLKAIQEALQEAQLDGWLFYDFHNRDAIAHRILEIDTHRFTSRRWFYFIPAKGEPHKIVHTIEPWRLDHLPGIKHTYLSWKELHDALRGVLAGARRVAMQYSPMNHIPYVSVVDGGTIDLVRAFGIEVVSSADLVGRFEARLDRRAYESHLQASEALHKVRARTFEEVSSRLQAGHCPTEYEIQQYMCEQMRKEGLVWNDGPIVAVNAHAADPHFEPTEANCLPIRTGDLLLVDLWAKIDAPGSIYADITWMGYIGDEVPERLSYLFAIVRQARETAVMFLEDRLRQGDPVHGWEVDEACRKVIADAGYGAYFIHRTGHSIGTEVHGNGVNIDNLETKDERLILPGCCFSIEPGIYLPEEGIGIRSEINVFVHEGGKVEVTGPQQGQIVAIPG
ncbi:MAG: aminopeptidase P family protein [candidate division KSB1 bacterium]|nr:aminopeptidase P family protein [candidate division KSB1 bacterium]